MNKKNHSVHDNNRLMTHAHHSENNKKWQQKKQQGKLIQQTLRRKMNATETAETR